MKIKTPFPTVTKVSVIYIDETRNERIVKVRIRANSSVAQERSVAEVDKVNAMIIRAVRSRYLEPR